MKKGKLKYVLGLIMATVMLGAAAIPVTEKIVDASSATTYTRTQNADGENVRCQDGYLPENTYDRIGLNAPKDMVIDKVFEGGKEVEYGYILNAPQSADPYLLKFINIAYNLLSLSNGSPIFCKPTSDFVDILYNAPLPSFIVSCPNVRIIIPALTSGSDFISKNVS